MARVCQVTGKRPMTGNNVSHAHNKTRRRFLPNLHSHRFWVESEERFVKLRVSANGMRNIDKKGMAGEAAIHAHSECENAKWAHHWVGSMWNAETPEEFWRCLMIAKTSMDARVSPKTPKDNRWALYAPVFRRARKSSIKERNKERIKRLVGQETPEQIFISTG